MTHRTALGAACVVLACLTTAVSAETLILKGGHQITGNILKSDDRAVIVEVGAAVLRVERADIARIDEPVAAATTQPAAATRPAGPVVEPNSPAWQLYHTAELPVSTIEENTRRFGEAVIMVTTPGGLGSGFVITPDGYCITNYHVIARETRIKVTVFRRTDTGFEQKNYRKVKIIALNPFVDLALLKIDGEGDSFTYACLGRMDELEAGQPVFAIGNPLGLTRTVSQGIISTKNRNFRGHLYIQTTTDVNPGNSGGPLFNMKGEVIGVTSMGYLFLSGLNFAIPVDVVQRFIDNRDAFAYNEDNDNAGFRYLQPGGRLDKQPPPPANPPAIEAAAVTSADNDNNQTQETKEDSE